MLADIAIFLAAAVIAVPVSRRLGLGSVLGYLAAGLIIGPWGLQLVTDVDSILHFSEFGVVLLLFLIGLELQPERLARLRGPIFGLGGAQVVLTTIALAAAAHGFGIAPIPALITGYALAMSSTAFVLQMLSERNELATREGTLAFAILLFQDLAVIPFIALVPLLRGGAESLDAAPLLRAIAIVGVVVLAGRFALRPALGYLARTGVPEIFTAASLLVVIGTALLMQFAGLSMPLGAFLAGVLLAESEYRRAIQADLEPFKGLLMGLFFIAVGMSVNLGLILQQPLLIAGLVVGLVAVKAGILYGLSRAMRTPPEAARAIAAGVSQGGEFAFVIFGIAAAAGLLEPSLRELLLVVVTLSMALTPPLYALQARFRTPLAGPRFDAIDAPAAPVIIIGFGPFGQIVGRLLRVRKIPFTVLEKDIERVDFVRRYGSTIYYGDAARIELLRAAHVDRARAVVLTISRQETSLAIARVLRQHFPRVRVFAVANDRHHALRLMDLGITDVVRRAFFSSLEMSRSLLMALGDEAAAADRTVQLFRAHDEATLLRQQAIHRDEQQMIQTTQEAARELNQLFESDVPEDRR